MSETILTTSEEGARIYFCEDNSFGRKLYLIGFTCEDYELCLDTQYVGKKDLLELAALFTKLAEDL